MFDWNDLKYLLSVSRRGSTLAAGRALGVSQSTVQRRLLELERRLGQVLVERRPTGYAMTLFGAELIPLAEAVEAAAGVVLRRAQGFDREGRQIIRLTCPEPVVSRLMPLIEQFPASHPGLRVEFATSDQYLDILKGDADLTFRSGDTDEALVGRKVADSVWGVYASADYIDRWGRPASVAELNDHRVFTLDAAMGRHRLVTWLDQVAPRAHIAGRSSSILGLVDAAKSGAGLAPLPCVIGAAAGLRQVLGPIPELARAWRLLTHPELRRVPRISAFFDFIEAQPDLVAAALG
jgi:DNA-binding transcriptional LysR family regulator